MTSPLVRGLLERAGLLRTAPGSPARRPGGTAVLSSVPGLLLLLAAAAALAVVPGAVPVRPLLPVAAVLVLALIGLAVEARARPADQGAERASGEPVDDVGAYYYDGDGRAKPIDDAF